MSHATDETAKWSMGERIDLAGAMARIESTLKNQELLLADLVDGQKVLVTGMHKAQNSADRASGRVRLHEIVLSVLASLIGLGIAVWHVFAP